MGSFWKYGTYKYYRERILYRHDQTELHKKSQNSKDM